MSEKADVVIVGGGIAGASLAYELAAGLKVVLLEYEKAPGYHSTGRSAAMLIDSYGSDAVRRLSRKSRAFFEQPPPEFADQPLVSPRPHLYVARADQRERLEAVHEVARTVLPSIRRLGRDEVLALAPLIDPGYADCGLLEPEAMAIDVAALHQGYLKAMRRRGGQLINYAVTSHIGATGAGFEVGTAAGSFEAGILVDAAGAWADQVAVLAGVETIGLVPKRRTAILIDPPEGADIAAWPMVTDIDDQFYVKPEGQDLLVSPVDATPAPPSDVQPEELDVAVAVDRYQTLTGREVRRVKHSWAGLRSFVGDDDPVIGFDPGEPRFFWQAGFGGFGIMTAPASAQLAAALVKGEALPGDLALLAGATSPARLRQSASG